MRENRSTRIGTSTHSAGFSEMPNVKIFKKTNMSKTTKYHHTLGLGVTALILIQRIKDLSRKADYKHCQRHNGPRDRVYNLSKSFSWNSLKLISVELLQLFANLATRWH